MGAYPQIVDWNEDRKIDLLVGDTNGQITLFINIAPRGDPQLASQGFVKAGGNDLNVGNRAAPVVVDWNNDGKKDLVVGDDEGYVRLYLNSGTNSEPLLTDYTKLQAGVNDIKNSYSASPEVCDLDADGKKDLLVSDYMGYVFFYRNVGEDANPAFSSRDYLQAGSSIMKTNSSYARIEVVDWDEDGDLDILVGEMDAYVNLFLNTTNPSAVTYDQVNVPLNFYLDQNFPNPFNSSTIINYQLPKLEVVNLSVFNLSGQLVRMLIDERQVPGRYSFEWDASCVGSGIYFIRLDAGSFSVTRKCIIEK